jgi:hypothetical protein
MAEDRLKMFRVTFPHAEFQKLDPEDQLFVVRLAQVADDLRFVQYLCAAAERGTRSRSPHERQLALHQLLFGVRLLYSTLHEGYEVIRTSWKTAHGKRWHSRLSQKGQTSLKRLHKYFASNQNLVTTIRHNFGFHYSADALREAVAQYPHGHSDIFTGRYSANIFYPFAEEIRARAMMQAASPKQARKLWDKGVSEAEIRTAAVELYTKYREPLETFQTLANEFLIPVVKALKPTSKAFTVRRVTKFRRMKPILFVEEPTA